MNSYPYRIGFQTVLFLVVLRVVVGWHFFQEGLAHKNDPHWSSEGFLRQAKGPLAEQFKSRVRGFHNWDYLLAVPLELKPEALPTEGNPQSSDKDEAQSKPAEAKTATLPNEGSPAGEAKQPAAKPDPGKSLIYGLWYQEIVRDWRERWKELTNFYHFTDEQRQAGEKVLDHYVQELAGFLHDDETDIATYRHELYRNVQMAEQPGAEEIPNEKSRIFKRDQNPVGEPGLSSGTTVADWLADAEGMEKGWQSDVLALRTDDQRKFGLLPELKTDLKKIDTVIIWVLIVGGGLLVVGLFTRLSALLLALFLLAVIASQPPWIPGAITTVLNYQSAELVALLALATSPVGRWAGLDFFVHYVLLRPFRKA